MFCKQKYCKHCVNPIFDNEGIFCGGYCKKSKHVCLFTTIEEAKDYQVQPLFCGEYEPRKRKINY